MIGSRRTAVITAATAAFLVHVVMAVGAQPPSARVTAYAPPRTADGKPDLHGIWQVLATAAWDLEDHSAELGVPAGQSVVEGNVIPYLPAAVAQRRNNYEHRHTADPNTKCYLSGVPRITYMPY